MAKEIDSQARWSGNRQMLHDLADSERRKAAFAFLDFGHCCWYVGHALPHLAGGDQTCDLVHFFLPSGVFGRFNYYQSNCLDMLLYSGS